MKDNQLISTLLDRGTADVIVRKELEQKLSSGKKLRVKLGIDPTGFDLTLGHAVVLRKLKQFQDLGHTVVFLFGGYTATIGDPTGKNETRPVLTEKEVEENAATYLEQAGKILDISKCEVRNNKEWLKKMSLTDGLELMSKKSAQQILARKDFKERMKKEVDIHLQEFLYPMLQGYDSVVLKSDIEIGGSDQLFNILVGRDLQKKYGFEQGQEVLTMKILVGLDGVEKMSKSLGNYIALDDSATDMFGKIMSISDDAMLDYFELCTDIDLKLAAEKIKESPRNAKVFLAQEIVRLYHGDKAVDEALRDFEQKFVKKEVPDDMPTFHVKKSEIGILELISAVCNFTKSNSDARRLVQQGAVTIDGEKITDPNMVIRILGEQVLKAGKRNWGRIIRE